MDKKTGIVSDEMLAKATCAVVIDGETKGTAWLASSRGHLLTAGHLLGTEAPRASVEIRFPEDAPRRAFKIQWGYHQEMGDDFAILKLANPVAKRLPLPISLDKSITGTFRLRGYGVTLKTQSAGRGVFLGPYDPQDSPGNRLFQLRSAELGQQGYSGAAVFSDKLQAVVAIQTEATKASTGPGRDTLLAMPLYRVAQRWEALQELATENTGFDCAEGISSCGIRRSRLQLIIDNIRQDLQLLKEYEDHQRLEDDPKRRRRYEREITALKKSIEERKNEYAQLSQTEDGRWFFPPAGLGDIEDSTVVSD